MFSRLGRKPGWRWRSSDLCLVTVGLVDDVGRGCGVGNCCPCRCCLVMMVVVVVVVVVVTVGLVDEVGCCRGFDCCPCRCSLVVVFVVDVPMVTVVLEDAAEYLRSMRKLLCRWELQIAATVQKK